LETRTAFSPHSPAPITHFVGTRAYPPLQQVLQALSFRPGVLLERGDEAQGEYCAHNWLRLLAWGRTRDPSCRPWGRGQPGGKVTVCCATRPIGERSQRGCGRKGRRQSWRTDGAMCWLMGDDVPDLPNAGSSRAHLVCWRLVAFFALLLCARGEPAGGPESLIVVGPELGSTSVTWNRESSRVATGHLGGVIRIWDPSTGKQERCIAVPDATPTSHSSQLLRRAVYDLAWSPNGKLLAAGVANATVRLFNPDTGEQVSVWQGEGAGVSITWSPDSRRLAAVLYGRGPVGKVGVWDVQSAREEGVLAGQTEAWCLAWSPDGRLLAVGSGDEKGGLVRLWDMATRQVSRTLRGYRGAVLHLSRCPDGRQLATSDGYPTIRIWDVRTGRLVRRIGAHPELVSSIAWRPDGKQLASAGDDACVKLWNAGTGKMARKAKVSAVTEVGRSLRSLTWSRDGLQLAGSSIECATQVWDLRSQKQLPTAPPAAGTRPARQCKSHDTAP
jgi:WD40 repeat protein